MLRYMTKVHILLSIIRTRYIFIMNEMRLLLLLLLFWSISTASASSRKHCLLYAILRRCFVNSAKSLTYALGEEKKCITEWFALNSVICVHRNDDAAVESSSTWWRCCHKYIRCTPSAMQRSISILMIMENIPFANVQVRPISVSLFENRTFCYHLR